MRALMTERAYRILMCSESYLPRISGVAHSLHALTSGLRARGLRVVIAAPKYPGYRDADPDVVRFPSLRPPHQPEFPLAIPYAPAVWRRLLDEDLDLVHTHAPFLMGAVAARLSRRRRLPLVFTHHTLYDEYVHYVPFVSRKVGAAAVRRFVTAYANRCACVIAPSRTVAQRLREHGVNTRIETIPTGAIDPVLFGSLDPSGVRRAYAIPADRPLLVTASRLAKEKSVDLVLEAFARILARRAASLLVVGGGPQERPLQELAHRLGVSVHTVFTGLLPHRRALECLAAGDIFMYGSQTETQGMVVVEAMAAGLPVVAVDAGGVPDAVHDGSTGYLVPPNADALASRALALLDDPGLRKMMGRTGMDASRAYSLDVVTQRVIDLYRSLVPAERRA